MTEQTQNSGLQPGHSLQEDLEVFQEDTAPVPVMRKTARENSIMMTLLSLASGMVAFSVVAFIVLAIVVPPWYRGLEPRYQAIWCNRVAVLCDLQPPPPDEDVLALEGRDVSESDRLLLPTETPVPTWTPSPVVTATDTPPVVEATEIAATATPTLTSTPTPSPTVTPIPYPRSASIDVSRLEWEKQGWNNCGPTTMSMGLQFFGYENNQYPAARFMKPYTEDKNVSPAQMVSYVNTEVASSIAVRAIYRVGGTPDMLRKFIHASFPVIVERGIWVDGTWMGHYSLVVGYDDTTEEYLLYDSYFGYGRQNNGEGRRYPQQEIEEGWKQFNYTFIVLYNPYNEQRVREILGTHADPAEAARYALTVAREQASVDSDDKWAWFNMGSAYTYLGDFENAALAFDRARTLSLPFRMLWYQFGPYRAYFHTGRYDDVLSLALANERLTPYVEEIYFYRGLVYAAQGNADSAVLQFDRALRFNRNFADAEEAKQQVLEGRFDPNRW